MIFSNLGALPLLILKFLILLIYKKQGKVLNMQNNIETKQTNRKPVTTYHEEKIKGTLYRVTSVYQGKIDLGKALEELTVRKILQRENALTQTQQ